MSSKETKSRLAKSFTTNVTQFADAKWEANSTVIRSNVMPLGHTLLRTVSNGTLILVSFQCHQTVARSLNAKMVPLSKQIRLIQINLRDTISDGSCSYAGIRFGNYKHIPQELLPCGKRCICNNGQIHCENTCPEIGDEPPLSLPCPTSLAFRGHLPGKY